MLYRTNAQSRVIEESFVQAGIRYRMYGGLKFYDRKEVKDILAYLRVLVNPADDISVRRIINVPKRAIGDTTVNELGAPRRAGGNAAVDRVHGYAGEPERPRAQERGEIQRADDRA